MNGGDEAAFLIHLLIHDPPHECGGLPICYWPPGVAEWPPGVACERVGSGLIADL